MPNSLPHPLFPSVSRRGFLAGGLGLLAASCTSQPMEAPNPLITKPTGAPLTVVMPNSDLAVGPNRFVLAMLDANNRPMTKVANTVRFYKTQTATTAVLKAETTATYYNIGPGDRGIYVARADFDTAGDWGLEVLATPAGAAQPLVNRAGFKVAEKSKTPSIGAAALPSTQLTTRDKPLSLICSANPADEFHDRTVAEALKNGKPIVLLLGSPGFCTSQTCGPNLEHLIAAKKKVGDQVQFIHIEIYKDAKPPDVVPESDAWGLPSEPWTFFINSAGKVVDKYEGGVASEELEPAIAKLLTA